MKECNFGAAVAIHSGAHPMMDDRKYHMDLRSRAARESLVYAKSIELAVQVNLLCFTWTRVPGALREVLHCRRLEIGS